MRAWWLLALVACGNGNGGGGGGGGPDGGGGGSGQVTAIIDNDGVPVAGARVLFQEADGTLAAQVMTDGSGRASAPVGAGGFVTAVNPYHGIEVLPDVVATVGGVEPGDQLVFHNRTNLVHTFTFPLTIPANPGTAIYSVGMTCDGIAVIDVGSNGHDTMGSDSVTGTGEVDRCPSGSLVDMLIEPSDADVALIVHDVTVGSGVPVTIPGSYAPYGSATIDVTNVPDGVTNMAFGYEVVTARGALLGIHQFSGSNAVVAGSESSTLAVPPGDYGFVDDETFAGGSALDKVDAVGWGDVATPVVTRDVSGAALPRFASVPAYDAASHAVTWQATAGAATPTMGYTTVAATRGGHQWVRSVLAPYTAGAVAFPELPTDTFDYNIGASDAPQATYTALVAVGPDGEAGVRGGVFATENPQNAFAATRTGSAGQMFIVTCDGAGTCK